MSDTTKRVLSAVIMVAILTGLFFIGRFAIGPLIILVSLILADEIWVNFSKKSRGTFYYFAAQILILFSTTTVFLKDFSASTIDTMVLFSLGTNLLLLLYLFSSNSRLNQIVRGLFGNFFSVGFYVSVSMIPILNLIKFDHWIKLIALLLAIAYSMDSGAWLFGKNFGKTKLWPAISPKKTVEGLLGGMFCSGMVGLLLSWLLFSSFNFVYLFVFALLGGVSQLGDLVQSKLKRQFAIKDSSNLIPGHGGIYDRVDSLIFLSPFYIFVIKYFNY